MDKNILPSSVSGTSSDTSVSDNSRCTKRQTKKIEKWLAKHSQNDILFLLSSTSGQLATIYDQFGSITRPIRVSMDGKHLIIGDRNILLDKQTLNISLGINTKPNHENYQTNSNKNINSVLSSMTDEQLENYVYTSFSLTNEYYDFDEINERYARRQLIASNLENTANNNEYLKPKHCVTLHLTVDNDQNDQDIVLEFANVRQKYLWARGLSKLMKCTKHKRKYRQKAVACKFSVILFGFCWFACFFGRLCETHTACHCLS